MVARIDEKFVGNMYAHVESFQRQRIYLPTGRVITRVFLFSPHLWAIKNVEIENAAAITVLSMGNDFLRHEKVGMRNALIVDYPAGVYSGDCNNAKVILGCVYEIEAVEYGYEGFYPIGRV